MSGLYAVYNDTNLADIAFEMFADAYPHEAAELDWQRFFALVKKRNPTVTEEIVKAMLAED